MTLRYKTKFTIEVLSEGRPVIDLTLDGLARATSEGDCVGRLCIEAVILLSSKEMADALTDFGSKPDFFQLDKDGKSI